jgi:hypothetical protein
LRSRLRRFAPRDEQPQLCRVDMAPRFIARFAAALLALSLAAVTQQGFASTMAAQVIGQAYDLASDQPLYRETHCVSGDGKIREVIYHNTEDTLIAHKTLRYETGLTTPSIVQRNNHTGDSVAVELRRGEVLMTRTERDAAQPKVVTRKPVAGLPVVIDAGFDAFVKDNWKSLLAGESIRFQFPFAAHESLVELEISSASCTYATRTDQCFSVQPGNWFLNMLSAPIELGYDATLRRLARFRGISNISDGEDGGLTVDIRYNYNGVASQDCGLNELVTMMLYWLHNTGPSIAAREQNVWL